ncbi:hypothetical protein [Halorientalis salina]|uniref:hypothetical protein n=1 Tax=Halorientalis salina TaxID=2932266 RepID=UPI0010ACE07E|nr:hypothetical protein [Halorientalis salina]
MAQSTTRRSVQKFTTTGRWSGAFTGGLTAGLVMGLLMQFLAEMMPMVGALYGTPTATAGWIAHVFHSVVLALVFAAIVTSSPGNRYATSPRAIVGFGLAYGAIIWLALAGVVMPVWLGAVGVPNVPVPNLTATSLGFHLVYGGILGIVYAIARAPALRRVADRANPDAQ